MKPNVLVVDGNQGMRDQLGRMLALRGYIVRLAADATDAHASLKASRPALVIATVDPPRLDAIALCRSVRESTGTPATRTTLMWSGDECDIWVFLDGDGRVIGRQGMGEFPPSWLGRIRNRLGL